MADSPWPTIHAERAALAADLASLAASQWSTPGLCPAWTVQQTLAHMAATAQLNAPGFLAGFVASGFRLNVLSEKRLALLSNGSGADTLAAFRAVVDSTVHP